MLVTKDDIVYRMPDWVSPRYITIPKGTKVIPATNLPLNSHIKYWAEPWPNMTDIEESHMRNYGFGLENLGVNVK